ncbi:uncharacterized protein DUF2637 [Kitasatospora sp. SolWspMP-SS2h]|uniref:DUF2637 domain-containing protein n=1 Tax=Kitasatospora sp. SolWspMP-SS2h TaxID=1305729 RepID=UPI000DBF855C|nr:DUF2637 domain-containing protein [Kitasatospora sp. SolWspMP-SS2h]RAJ32323.1 uncharacterized protein DUF2637 [Kitasatospora sp. SolWspMP-SS2h]
MARPSLTRAHRALLGVVAIGACVISGIGFAGSYNSVRDLAMEKGFGAFSYAFPIGVDAGIVVLLSLDLVLTWLRIPFPLLRQTAWLLTAATIAFNAAASWGDALGMAMHAVIPVLFVVVVEASRHAVGRIAAITADRHMESVRLMRWVLSPVPTFRLWRRMKLWELRSYDETVRLEQNRLVYRAQLRFRYGRGWRRSAPFQALLPLKLAKYGVPLDPTVLDRIDGPLVVPGSAAAVEQSTQAVPAVQAGPSAQVVAAGQPVQAARGGVVTQAQQPVQAQAQALAQAQAAASGAPESQPQPQPQPVPPVSAAVAVPTLAKLAAVRLRDQQDPEAAQAAPVIDSSAELNVWTARPVRSHVAEPDQVHTARVPGQASPWFKAPRPSGPEEAVAVRPQPGYQASRAEAYPEQGGGPEEYRAEEYRPAANGHGPAWRPQAVRQQVPVVEGAEPILVPGRPMRLESMMASEPEPLPFDEGGAPARRPIAGAGQVLDADECFDALVSYMEENQRHPDERRFAEYLSQRGVPGSRPDGGVTVKDVEKVWQDLQERYMESGRGE